LDVKYFLRELLEEYGIPTFEADSTRKLEQARDHKYNHASNVLLNINTLKNKPTFGSINY
jgi:hypothetical protein